MKLKIEIEGVDYRSRPLDDEGATNVNPLRWTSSIGDPAIQTPPPIVARLELESQVGVELAEVACDFVRRELGPTRKQSADQGNYERLRKALDELRDKHERRRDRVIMLEKALALLLNLKGSRVPKATKENLTRLLKDGGSW